MKCRIVETDVLRTKINTGGEGARTQTKTVTPKDSVQKVYPDEGYLLSSVTVEAIPSPHTQKKTVIPTKQQQSVTPDEGYLLDEVVVEPIPSQYYDTRNADGVAADLKRGKVMYGANGEVIGTSDAIIPSGKITLTENATGVDIAQYAEADVEVPMPTMPEEYCVGGSLIAKTLTEYHCAGTGTEIRTRMFDGCTSLRTVNLPNTITSIKAYAFSGCVALELSQLPTSISSIETYAFQNCEKISFKDIPSAVTVPTIACFSGCKGLTEINFLGDITTMQNAAFSGCSNVLSFKFLHNTAIPPMNNTNVFNGINANAKIVVPDNLVTAWKAATNWVTYADKIIGESDYNA